MSTKLLRFCDSILVYFLYNVEFCSPINSHYEGIKMIKKIFVTTLLCLSSTIFACDKAVPTTNPNFCSSFTSVAYCHCMQNIHSSIVCSNMTVLYNAMLQEYHSLESACAVAAKKHEASQQECIDDWNCYWNGGRDSTGGLCSGNGQRC